MTEPRTLFSVIESGSDGEKFIYVDWHRDLHEALNELSPDGQITDKIIDIAEELIHAFDEEDE